MEKCSHIPERIDFLPKEIVYYTYLKKAAKEKNFL